MSNIEINDLSPRNQYLSYNGQTVFIYDFPIKSQADLLVYKRSEDATPNDTVDKLILNINYTVTGVGSQSGGTIILTSGASLNDVITIERAIPLARSSVYVTDGTIKSEDLEIDFDNIVMELQQERMLSQIRGLTYPRSSIIASKDQIIPILQPGQSWRMNASGTEIKGVYDLSVGDIKGTENQINVTDTIYDSTISIANNPTIPGTSHILIPRGTTAQRPASPIPGMIRYDTDLENLQEYEDGDWQNILITGTGAPRDARYITQQPTDDLVNEQALSLLPTGIMKSTFGTGVISTNTSTTDLPEGDNFYFTDLRARSSALSVCVPITYIDIDPTLAADSDTKIPSQKAIKKYVEDSVKVENTWDRVSNYLIPHVTTDEIGASTAQITKGWFNNLELKGSNPVLNIINTDDSNYGSWRIGTNNNVNFTLYCIKSDGSTQLGLAFQKKLSDGSIDFGYLSSNLGIGTTSFGSSATKTLSMGIGTVPTTSPDNCFQMYASDFSEGNAVPTFRTGSGVVVKLNQDVSTVSYPVLAGLTITGLSGVLKATAGVISGSASKSDIGLGNVDNTSDASKPISSATQTALNTKQDSLGFTAENIANKSTSTSLGTSNTYYPTQNAVKSYVDALVGQIFNIQGDWNANTNTPNITGETHVGYAWRVSVAGSTNLGGYTNWNVGDIAIKTSTGWMQIVNSDISAVWGNISGTLSNQTDLSNALGGKEPTITAGTTAQYWRGDKSWQTLDKSAVGLNNVDNTSDANKPVSSATQTALNAKQDSITGAASSIVTSNLSANKILISTAAGKVDASAVTTTTLGYLDATSSIQSQLNAKQATITGAATTITGDNLTANRVAISNASGKMAISAVTTTTLGYLDATSSIQTQLNGKQAAGNYITALTGDVTASGPGSVAATIANGSVSLAKMANLAANSIIGNNTAGATTPIALTAAQTKTLLSLVKGDVGLGNVDNTSDANKPVSTATQTALNLKENTISAGTTAQYWRGDKSWQALNSTAVGLANVTNDAQVKKIASATDNAVVRWDSTTGALVQNSTVTIDDNAVIAGSLTKIAFNNPIANNQISLWGGSSPTHVFYGFGIASGILRYQVDTANSAHVFYYATGASSSTEIGRLYSQGISLNSATIGTNGTGVISLKTGVAPASSPDDCVQYYSSDAAAGNACPTFRTENGTVIRLSEALMPLSYLDTDGTLAANSDTKVASQKAVKTYVDNAIGGENIWNRVTGTPNYVIPTTAADDVGATAARITKGWFTNLEVTNAYSLNGTAQQNIATTASPSFRAVTLSGTDPVLNIVNTDGSAYGSWDIGTNNIVNFVIDCVKIDTTKQIALAFQKKLSDGSIDFGYTSANFGIGTASFGTNAAKVLSMGAATAPANSPANCFQMYSDLYNAGTNVPTFRLESGTVVQLAQNLTPLSAVTFNGVTSNDDVNLAVNKVYKINGTQIGFANLGDQLAVNGLCYGDPSTMKLNSNYAIYYIPASNSLNCAWNTNDDTGILNINSVGYQSGTTKFRSFCVQNGKGTTGLLYVGSTNTFSGYGDWGTSGRMTAANLTVTAFSTAGMLINNASGVISSTLTPQLDSIKLGVETLGTNATNTIIFSNGTAPASSVADCFQLYSTDFAAGNAVPTFRTENGTICKINQDVSTTATAQFAKVGLGTATFGTNATNTLCVINGTIPASSPTDSFQLYSSDHSAGNACPTFRTENGTICLINQDLSTAANAIFAKINTNFNGGSLFGSNGTAAYLSNCVNLDSGSGTYGRVSNLLFKASFNTNPYGDTGARRCADITAGFSPGGANQGVWGNEYMTFGVGGSNENWDQTTNRFILYTWGAYFSSLGTGTVYSNGGVLTNTNPSYSAWKDNVETLDIALDKVLQLRPVSYTWKKDIVGSTGEIEYGFLADEVEKVIPEITGESFAEFINEDGTKRKEIGVGIYSDRFLPFIVKSMQDMYDAMSWFVDVPESSDSPGEIEEMSFDDDYLYVCVKDNDWRRLPMERW